ncbi:protein of unknown function [Sterolibacterium denitrificans]|uniref:DUF6701 domain-containing protein n=1 Tax=Sterolibacterium denitrificans TaxID=157592 RepID=A0A7Z7HQ60_9PROT|nr:DUF6701 domain-containing protein [Sterolibacterium denitrificans]SMB24377.1 protein of unknown function [Sterolibacterium denitrificans]
MMRATQIQKTEAEYPAQPAQSTRTGIFSDRLSLMLAILAVPFVLSGCPADVTGGFAEAVEVGGALGSNIYTKVAAQSFTLEVIAGAVKSGNKVLYVDITTGLWPFQITTRYWAQGDSKIDLVDVEGKPANFCGTIGDANQVAGASLAGTSGVAAYGGGNSGRYNWTGGEQSKKQYTFTVPNAVANVRVRMWGKACAGANCAEGTYCSVDSFTIRPANFTVASTPTSAATQVAGATYTMTVTAVNSSGATTTNYKGSNVKPSIDASKLKDWTGGAIPGASFSGSLSDAVNGVATGSNFAYTDFGQLTIPAGSIVDNSFSGKSNDIANNNCIAGSSSNTLSGGKYGCNIANQAAASTPRFVPDHYEVNHVFTPACASGAFTYLGQPFGALTLTVEAKNSAGNNMTRLTAGAPSKPTISVAEKNSGTLLGTYTKDGSSGTVPVTLTTPEWPVDGTTGGRYANLSKATLRPAAEVLYDDFALTTTVTDADSRKIEKCNGSTVVATTSCTSAPTKLRYGLLELSDGLGAAGLPAAIRVRALYWNGTAFVQNTADSCTTIENNGNTIASNLVGSTLTGLLSKNDSTMLTNGVGALMIGSQDDKTGSAPIALKLGSSNNNCISATTSGAGTLNALSDHLGSYSCWGSLSKDPSATVSFGTLRTPYIYRSEKF